MPAGSLDVHAITHGMPWLQMQTDRKGQIETAKEAREDAPEQMAVAIGVHDRVNKQYEHNNN